MKRFVPLLLSTYYDGLHISVPILATGYTIHFLLVIGGVTCAYI